MRVVGIDLGQRRIGVAVSDGAGALASPWCTIERRGDTPAVWEAVTAVVDEVEAGCVVVGLPLSLDGRVGPAARAARAEAAELAEALASRHVPVETFDERLTTVSAARSLAAAGHRGPRQRQKIDAAAATVMLQAWLDTQRGRRDG